MKFFCWSTGQSYGTCKCTASFWHSSISKCTLCSCSEICSFSKCCRSKTCNSNVICFCTINCKFQCTRICTGRQNNCLNSTLSNQRINNVLRNTYNSSIFKCLATITNFHNMIGGIDSKLVL